MAFYGGGNASDYLGRHVIVNDTVTNSTWIHNYMINVTSFLANASEVSRVTIRLGINDTQGIHEAWFDNIKLYSSKVAQPHYYYDQFIYDYLGSFDTIAEGYYWEGDWIAIDPYVHQLREPPNKTYLNLSIIFEDADWALTLSDNLVLFGDSYDPPHSATAPFFEANDDYIMPRNETLWEYYTVAKEKGATALIWWWYPDSYASSAHGLPSYVNNAWEDEQKIWEEVAKG